MKSMWATKPFSDIAKVFNGNTVSDSDKKNLYGGDLDGLPYVATKDVGFDNQINYDTGVTIPESSSKQFKIAPPNCVFVCAEGGSAGKKIAHNNRKVCFGNKLFAVVPNENMDSRYIYYFCLSVDFQTKFKKEMTGLIGGVSISKFKGLTIPTPPLDDQKNLVQRLDQAFDDLASSVEIANSNLRNAREVFDSEVEAILERRGDGWLTKTLDQVCIVERGSSPRPIKNFLTTESDGVNWVKIGDTEEGGKYVYSTVQKITPEGAKSSRFVKEGDFILTNSMSYGRPYIMKTNGCIHDGWFVLRLNQELDTDYFYYLLASKYVQSQFARLASGAVVKNISGDLVKKTVLPIPPLADQKIIVGRLIQLSEEIESLEAVYEQKLTAFDELKLSILNRAFAGEFQ